MERYFFDICMINWETKPSSDLCQIIAGLAFVSRFAVSKSDLNPRVRKSYSPLSRTYRKLPRRWIGIPLRPFLPPIRPRLSLSPSGNCECFPGRVRTILTSRGDKADGKIRRCRRNKGEMYWNGGVGSTVNCSRKDRSFSPSFLKLRAAARNRIQYSNRGARSRTIRRVYVYACTYISYISCRRWIDDGITNERKSHVIGNDLLLHVPPPRTLLIVPCRVSKRQGRPMGIAIYPFQTVFLQR